MHQKYDLFEDLINIMSKIKKAWVITTDKNGEKYYFKDIVTATKAVRWTTSHKKAQKFANEVVARSHVDRFLKKREIMIIEVGVE